MLEPRPQMCKDRINAVFFLWSQESTIHLMTASEFSGIMRALESRKKARCSVWKKNSKRTSGHGS
jgi:hypothetical protein